MNCKYCGGPSDAMGQLGPLVWFKCQNCGSEYAIPVDEIEVDFPREAYDPEMVGRWRTE